MKSFQVIAILAVAAASYTSAIPVEVSGQTDLPTSTSSTSINADTVTQGASGKVAAVATDVLPATTASVTATPPPSLPQGGIPILGGLGFVKGLGGGLLGREEIADAISSSVTSTGDGSAPTAETTPPSCNGEEEGEDEECQEDEGQGNDEGQGEQCQPTTVTATGGAEGAAETATATSTGTGTEGQLITPVTTGNPAGQTDGDSQTTATSTSEHAEHTGDALQSRQEDDEEEEEC